MKRRITLLLTVVFIALIGVGGYYGVTHYLSKTSSDSISYSSDSAENRDEWNLILVTSDSISYSSDSAENRDEWNLILVNAKHSIPENYEVSLLELSNGIFVDERIYPDLQQMFDDARADGIFPIVGEGYRTHQAQEEIMENKVNEYRGQGYSNREAEKLAKEWVAVPGTSEHELGLALDINAAEGSDSWEVYTWLADNAYRYGFILRYPLGKEKITGIDYEPWHYRYVGKNAALEIYQQDITLEEYLEQK